MVLKTRNAGTGVALQGELLWQRTPRTTVPAPQPWGATQRRATAIPFNRNCRIDRDIAVRPREPVAVFARKPKHKNKLQGE